MNKIDLRKNPTDIDLRKKLPDLPDEDRLDRKRIWFPEIVESQKGLEQVGDTPIWTTPLTTPISPFDCDRWPSSPYCGGNPIDTESVGIDIDLVIDKCYLGVQLSGSLGFIKSPNLQINVRNPNGDCDPPSPTPPPPDRRPRIKPPRKPPPPRNEDCCMSCCVELLRQVRLLRKEIGFGKIQVPQSLLTQNGKTKGNKKMQSLSQLVYQQIIYMDELLGQWEVEVSVKDSQGKTEILRLPNLSAAVGFLAQTGIDTQQSGAIAKNASARALLETAQTKQVASKIYWAVETIVEYLGYKTESKTEEIKYLCKLFDEKEGKTLAVSSASEFLKESSMKTERLAYKPSHKEENFQDVLFDLAHAAAIIRAAFFVRADEANPAQTIKDRVKGENANLEKLVDTEKSAEDFQQELKHIENAWGHLPQRTEPDDPWGEPYSDRPKIKDITPGNQQQADVDGRA